MADSKYIYYGIPYPGFTGGGVSSLSLNQATDALELIFQVPQELHGETLSSLGIRQTTLTGVAPVYRVSLQGVDASGNPDGVIKGASNTVYNDYTPITGNNSTWQWLTPVDAAYTFTGGAFLALVVQHTSGTIDVSNFCSFTSSLLLVTIGLPYTISNDNGVRTRSSSRAPAFAVKTASGKVYGFPMNASTSLNYNVNTTAAANQGDEWATRFLLPAAMGSTYKIAGVRIPFSALPAAQTTKFILYSGTTVLQDVTLDNDVIVAVNTPLTVFFDESSLTALSFGTEYRLGIQPQGASTTTLSPVDVAVAGDLAAYPGGTALYSSYRTDAGAWSDLTTRRLPMDLIISDITEMTPAAASDVRSGIDRGDGTLGTLTLPTVGNVVSGVQFGGGGTEYTGTYVVTAVGNVRLGTAFGAGSAQTGTLALPSAIYVLTGVQFGASGTEFTGTMAGATTGDVAAAVVAALAGQTVTTRTFVQREHVELYRGDEYKSSEGTGRRISFTKVGTETHWPDLLDSVHVYIEPTAEAIANGRATALQILNDVACTITQATGASQAFYLELTKTQTDDLSSLAWPHDYEFQLVANKADYPATIREGTFSARQTLRTLA